MATHSLARFGFATLDEELARDNPRIITELDWDPSWYPRLMHQSITACAPRCVRALLAHDHTLAWQRRLNRSPLHTAMIMPVESVERRMQIVHALLAARAHVNAEHSRDPAYTPIRLLISQTSTAYHWETPELHPARTAWLNRCGLVLVDAGADLSHSYLQAEDHPLVRRWHQRKEAIPLLFAARLAFWRALRQRTLLPRDVAQLVVKHICTCEWPAWIKE